MKIYSISNGYVGDGITKVLVCANSEKRALELAEQKFREEFKEKKHYNNLEILDVFDNLDREWASEVNQLDNH